jgi:hypothetical protein
VAHVASTISIHRIRQELSARRPQKCGSPWGKAAVYSPGQRTKAPTPATPTKTSYRHLAGQRSHEKGSRAASPNAAFLGGSGCVTILAELKLSWAKLCESVDREARLSV